MKAILPVILMLFSMPTSANETHYGWQESIACQDQGRNSLDTAWTKYDGHGYGNRIFQFVLRDYFAIESLRENGLQLERNRKGELIFEMGNSNTTILDVSTYSITSNMANPHDPNTGVKLEINYESLPVVSIRIYETEMPQNRVLREIDTLSMENCSFSGFAERPEEPTNGANLSQECRQQGAVTACYVFDRRNGRLDLKASYDSYDALNQTGDLRFFFGSHGDRAQAYMRFGDTVLTQSGGNNIMETLAEPGPRGTRPKAFLSFSNNPDSVFYSDLVPTIEETRDGIHAVFDIAFAIRKGNSVDWLWYSNFGQNFKFNFDIR